MQSLALKLWYPIDGETRSMRNSALTYLSVGFHNQRVSGESSDFRVSPKLRIEVGVSTLGLFAYGAQMFRDISEIVDEFVQRLHAGEVCRCEVLHQERGDSVLEERFWHMLRKTELGLHGTAQQVPIGRYRVDGLIDCDGQAVVIELDGKRFHNPDADRIRDAALLQSVDAIIRIPFAAMWYYRYATFKILESWYPRFAITSPVTMLSEDELKEERDQVDADFWEYGETSVAEWLADVDGDYEVYRVDGPHEAFVGNPKQFLCTSPKVAITQRHGQAQPGMVHQVWAHSGCSPLRKQMQEVG